MTMRKMFRSVSVPACALLLAAGLAAPAFAHAADAADDQHEEHAAEAAHDHAAMMSGDAAMKESLEASFDGATQKLVDLAEAIPAEKYSWRPAEGVRSVSEVFMHVAGANYFLSTPFGQEMPEGVTQEMEADVTEKTEVVTWLKNSIANAKQAVAAADLSQGGEKIPFFGQEMSRDTILLILVSHAHEHLGQAIAYARSNGVTPPWSGGS